MADTAARTENTIKKLRSQLLVASNKLEYQQIPGLSYVRSLLRPVIGFHPLPRGTHDLTQDLHTIDSLQAHTGIKQHEFGQQAKSPQTYKSSISQ
jgi:hypothetical protein